jgi:predicted nucleic acid-binding protein
MLLLLDSSVIIAFMTEMDDGEYLRALSLRGFKLVVTDGVLHEVKKEPGISRLRKAIKEKWIEVQLTSKTEYEFFKKRYPMLDYAEVEIIQKGIELKYSNVDYCCVLDEGAGRRVADGLGLSKTGTEGLLSKMNHLGVVDAAIKKKLLNKLGQSTFRSSGLNASVRDDQAYR